MQKVLGSVQIKENSEGMSREVVRKTFRWLYQSEEKYFARWPALVESRLVRSNQEMHNKAALMCLHCWITCKLNRTVIFFFYRFQFMRLWVVVLKQVLRQEDLIEFRSRVALGKWSSVGLSPSPPLLISQGILEYCKDRWANVVATFVIVSRNVPVANGISLNRWPTLQGCCKDSWDLYVWGTFIFSVNWNVNKKN